MLKLLFLAWLAAFSLMSILWIIHILIKNAAIVDIGWSAGLGLIAIIYYFFATGSSEKRLLICSMAVLWSARLTLHLSLRLIGKPEEGRYRTLRENWKTSVAWKFFIFFQIQGILDVILSVPFLLVCQNTASGISTGEWVGLSVWAIGMCGETLSDWQLARFKKDPANKGKTCRAGLWKYSRHPNFFFESLNWFGFALAAFFSPFGYLGIISPLIILYFLFNITGIPPTEAQARKSRYDYEEYQKTTNMFIPWFPKYKQS